MKDDERAAWRRWLRAFCWAFFGGSALLYTLLILTDPYDTGRFPNFGIVGIDDINPRTANASRGRDPHFNASIIGNSSGQNLNPYSLSEATGLHFQQLTIPQTGPREQLAEMRWIMANHKTYGAFVIVTDHLWCTPDPHVAVNFPFPFWLYRGDLEYLANVLSSKSLDRAAWRLRVAFGLKKPMDPIRFSFYGKGEDLVFAPEPPALPTNLGEEGSTPKFPWADELAKFIHTLPASTEVAVVVPPVYYKFLSPHGSETAKTIEACKHALAQTVAGRPHSGFLDFRVDNAEARNIANWIDNIHYRVVLAPAMDQRIISVLRAGSASTSDISSLDTATKIR